MYSSIFILLMTNPNVLLAVLYQRYPLHDNIIDLQHWRCRFTLPCHGKIKHLIKLILEENQQRHSGKLGETIPLFYFILKLIDKRGEFYIH